jgi:hypothetical protein
MIIGVLGAVGRVVSWPFRVVGRLVRSLLGR